MGIIDLWLPIVASAVIVFIASSLIHVVLKWHNSDYRKTGDEENVRSALSGSEPGFYLLPYCIDPAELQKEEVAQKYKDGPLAYITVVPNGLPQMGPALAKTFVYYLFVGALCAYVVSRTVAGGADYLEVFRVAGTVAWIAHGVAIIPDSIWYGKPWSVTGKYLVDALIYGLLTGGVFGWLA